jgi:NADPH-dependent curcumin reductase CurA
MTLSSVRLARTLQLVAQPSGLPQPSDFAIVAIPLPTLKPGQLLVRNRLLSIDPALRPPMSNGVTALGQPIASLALGEVVASEAEGIAPGTMVIHRQGLRDWAMPLAADVEPVTALPGEPLHWHLGPLGFIGLTAYAGLFVVGQVKPGETLFVSAGAGAVGALVCQIGRAIGCRVVASAGGADKCRWLREVARVDAAIDYRAGDLRHALKQAAPEGFDLYFDNVGGDHLEAALPRMRRHGRVALCGMISAYNSKGALSKGVTTLASTLYNRVRLEAFIWQDHLAARPQFLTAMRRWLGDGTVVVETCIHQSLEAAPAALIGMLQGANLGKTLVALD